MIAVGGNPYSRRYDDDQAHTSCRKPLRRRVPKLMDRIQLRRKLAGQASPVRSLGVPKALIIESSSLEQRSENEDYVYYVTYLIAEQLKRARPLESYLVWPKQGALASLCESLYAYPADLRNSSEWEKELGVSERTLPHRFEEEVGMNFRSWRLRLRLFKAVELLNGGLSVTSTALELGYSSTSAFINAFRAHTNNSPQEYMKRNSEM